MNLKQLVRSSIIRATGSPLVNGLFDAFGRDQVAIFTLHRMHDPANGIIGHSPEFLRSTLSYLKRSGYNLVSTRDVYNRLRREGPPLRRAVAFTMDDGFIDQATIAAPIFAEFDCPVTIFLISGFLDHKLWPWDDQVSYIFSTTKRRKLSLCIGGNDIQYDLSSESQRVSAVDEFRNRVKLVAEVERLQALDDLSRAADVEVPRTPIEPYLPMTWDMARQLERSGVTFAPHTVSHAILSRTTQARARDEISESWRRLKEELSDPLPFLAYPTGSRIDFGVREFRLLEDAGLSGAVTTIPGHVDLMKMNSSRFARFQLNRYAFPDNIDDVIQYCSWLERTKMLLRMERLRGYVTDNFVGPRHLLTHYLSRLWDKLGGYRVLRNIDWTRVTRLVFVSQGNICRGPYAEVFAQSTGLAAVSFGLTTKTGTPASPQVIKNAAACGIDLDPHRSQRGEDVDTGPGDLLIGMELWQATSLQRMAKKKNAQVTLLGLWDSPPHPDIHDPCGQGAAYFQACFSVIEASVDGMAKYMTQAHAASGPARRTIP